MKKLLIIIGRMARLLEIMVGLDVCSEVVYSVCVCVCTHIGMVEYMYVIIMLVSVHNEIRCLEWEQVSCDM